MRLSIIVPVKNGAGYILNSVRSVTENVKGRDDVELIVVDDASTDGSGEIAAFAGSEMGDRFRIVANSESRGCGGARNAGVEVATGDYLAFLDADDWYLPGGIERIVKATETDPDVIVFPFTVIRAPGSKLPKGLIPAPDVSDPRMIGCGPVAPWCQSFRRELFVPMPERIMSEDTAWHYEQFDLFKTAVKVDGEDPVYVYNRRNATAITDTVEWCGEHSYTLEQLACEDIVVKAGKNDQWISDLIRNLANMYDVRRKLKNPWVKAAWKGRFLYELQNIMTGHYTH